MNATDGSELPVLDPAVLPRAVGNQEEIIAQVVEAYTQTMTETGNDLGAALSRDDAESVARLAHKIKGGAANLGGKRLSHLAADLETSASDGDLTRCRTLATALEEALAQLLAALQKGPWTP